MRTLVPLSLLAAILIGGCSYLNSSGGGSGGSGGGGGGGGGSSGGGGTTNTGGSATHNYSGKVSGTVLYRERMLLPADAVVFVQLVDSGGAIVAEQQIRTMGAAPPYKYVLNYDRSKIRAAERYQVRSDIMLRGGKRFTTVTPIPVITLGGPDTAEIVVQAVRQ